MSGSYSKTDFERLIRESLNDEAALAAIDLQLQKLATFPWAKTLRLRVVNLRRQALGRARSDGDRRTTVDGGELSLPRSSGRPLYRYRVSDEDFQRLEAHIRSHRQRMSGFRSRQDSAAFVLWSAEWFRRCFTGRKRRWQDLGDRLNLALSQAEWRSIADEGLTYWGISPLRFNGMRHRLLSLARQGGFPVAAVEASGGWAARYLQQLVGLLLGVDEPTTGRAFDEAEGLQHLLPETWRFEDFYLVSADLALAVVQLRREAEQNGAISGLPVSVWLDANRPDWLDDLPLAVDSEAGRQLIDGLLKTERSQTAGGSSGVARLLVRAGDVWRQKLLFRLDGRLDGSALGGLHENWSRLRMYPGGGLARHLTGELAIVEPDESGAWQARSRTSSAIVDLAFAVAADVEFHGGGERIGSRLTLPGGEAVHSQMLVLRPRDGGESECDPVDLQLIGTRSGGYAADVLFIVLPSTWKIESTEFDDDFTSDHVGALDDGRMLWRIRGVAYISSDHGDRYLVRTGQNQQDRDTLVIDGVVPTELDCDDHWPVVLGRPSFYIEERRNRRIPGADEVWWRPLGSKSWKPVQNAVLLGLCEVCWRDGTTKIIRDRAVYVFLPDTFSLTVRRVGRSVEILVGDWPGTVSVRHGVATAEPGTWRLLGTAAHQPRVAVTLQAAGVTAATITRKLPSNAAICRWDGTPVAPRQTLSLHELSGFVALADGQCRMRAELRDRYEHRIGQGELDWGFDSDLPLSAVRDDIAALLRPLGDLDASVRLSVSEGHEEHWDIREFNTRLTPEPRGLVPTKLVVADDVRVVGRALHHPEIEKDFGEYGRDVASGCRPIELPRLKGSWLIYLRDDQRVHTRPFLLVGEHIEEMPAGFLGKAMAIADRNERLEAVAGVLSSCRSPEIGPRILDEIIALAASLDGLPPSTFDVFTLLPRFPEVAIRLLFQSDEQQLQNLIDLESGLPFAWACLPRSEWSNVAKARLELILDALPQTIPESSRTTLAHEAILTLGRRIAASEPALSAIVGTSSTLARIQDVAQAFMQRAHDRADRYGKSPFRPQMNSVFPTWDFDEAFWRALDAPCAAAFAALGRIVLSDEQVRCVKDIAWRHPRYFADAYAAILSEHPNG